MRKARARIMTRIDRVQVGNLGDCKALGNGLYELRVDWGPGYRVYFARIGKMAVLLLCAGDKRTQSSDIVKARECLEDYKRRTVKG
ncbi:MAG TPA: type II toxin-antitoxin system RelE/ParE family toxin [Terriglobales bacterium]|nr:type II toxin-antitoxin system RelE/ParE family toxin [Terriglobales bacterium]